MQFTILYQSLHRKNNIKQSELTTFGEDVYTNLNHTASFEALSEILTEGIMQCNLEGVIRYCNSKMTELTGFSKGELIGKSVFSTLVPAHSRQAMLDRYQNRKKGISEEYELELLKKNGTSFWAHLRAKPFRNEKGEITGVVGAYSDFTDAQGHIEDSNYRRQFLRQLIDTSPNIIYSVNADGRFSVVNKTFSELVGIPIKELVGKEISQLSENSNTTVEAAKILDIFSHRRQTTSNLKITYNAKPYKTKIIRKELLLPLGKDRQVLSIGTLEEDDSQIDAHALNNIIQKVSAEAEIALLRKVPADIHDTFEKILSYCSQAGPQEFQNDVRTVPVIRKRVLVIDDEEQIVELLSNLLQVSGFIVHGFTSGEEALAWASVHDNTIDAVILDLKMQEMNGNDCLHALKKICPHAPIIILSGYVESSVEKNLLDQGATKFFHKPLRYAQLVACLRELLGVNIDPTLEQTTLC